MRWMWLGALALLCDCRYGFDAQADAGGQTFLVGGTVSGLATDGIVLALNGGDPFTVDSDGTFQFTTPILDGTAYAVTIASQPATQNCIVANGEGTIAGAPVVDIEVTCFAAGACPAIPITYVSDGSFALPPGCTSVNIDAFGGGGAGAAKGVGNAGVAGGAGGHATKMLVGQPGTYTIKIGKGGTCSSTVDTAGGYAGGRGGVNSGDGNGGDGAGAGTGGAGGLGPTGTQPGGDGGRGGYGGGGGGGGGDAVKGSSGGGATFVRINATDLVVAGGGGAGGASDQNGDEGGRGGAACVGYNGADGASFVAGTRAGGGGGGGGCFCTGGSCNVTPTSTGGAGGAAGTQRDCTASQNGIPGRVVITFQ